MGEALDADVIAVRLTGPFRFVVAAAPAYIARYGRPETPGDLREHRCVRLRLGTGAMMPWTFARGNREFEVAVTGPVIVNDFHAMMVAVSTGARKSVVVGKSVSIRVRPGGRRINKNKKKNTYEPEKQKLKNKK